MLDHHLLSFSLTHSEWATGGLDSLEYWLRVVDAQIMAHHYRYQGRQISQWSSQVMSNVANQIDQNSLNYLLGQQGSANNAQTSIDAQMLYGWNMANQQWPVREEDAKATQKAKDLFKLACGVKAFETLDSGKPLPIIGSKGTKYTLHKRSTYCVERTKDGAKLCAVVPGVPLWDHLLGIKLMVENDEPAFLKTANVTGGRGEIWDEFRRWLT